MDINYTKGYKLVERKKYDISDIENLDITVERGEVEITTIKSNYIEVDYLIKSEGHKVKYYYSDYKSNKGLNIELKRKFSILPFDFFEGLCLKVSIPEQFNSTLKVKTTTTNINLNNITLNKLYLNSASGNINLDEIKVSNLDINTVNGDIDIRKICENVFGNNKSQIRSTTGNISMKFKTLYSKNLISTTTGNIKIGVDSTLDNYNINTYTVTKLHKAPKSTLFSKKVYEIDVKTTAGKIKIYKF